MSDIVDWLREGYELMYTPDGSEIDPVATKEKLNKAADEITRLRTELAEVRAELEWQMNLRYGEESKASAYKKQRDTLRQQLAVAREGLGEMLLLLNKITAAMTQGVTNAYYEADTIKKLDECYDPSHAAIEQAEDLIRATLAKLDQMSQSRSEIGTEKESAE